MLYEVWLGWSDVEFFFKVIEILRFDYIFLLVIIWVEF